MLRIFQSPIGGRLKMISMTALSQNALRLSFFSLRKKEYLKTHKSLAIDNILFNGNSGSLMWRGGRKIKFIFCGATKTSSRVRVGAGKFYIHKCSCHTNFPYHFYIKITGGGSRLRRQILSFCFKNISVFFSSKQLLASLI
jgi:hypothetical protein